MMRTASRQRSVGKSDDIPRPAHNAPFHPGGDAQTYRDLLLFEERLKMNAEMLKRRKRRYGAPILWGSAFLWSFVFALAWLGHRMLFLPPAGLLAMRALQATIAVVVITLALFFASGMYDEKIRYAHSYINHSNKALRPLNMHLNMRRPGISFSLSIPYFRSATPIPQPSLSAKPSLNPTYLKPPVATVFGGRRVSSSSTVMAQIPPSSNPRGELIFSSRVQRTFREGYERYRAAFERRREEKAREEALKRGGKRWFRRGLLSEGPLNANRLGTPTPPASRRGTPPPTTTGTGAPGAPPMETRTSSRGRTPSPGLQGSRLRNVAGDSDGEKRTRAESYSFVWGGQDEAAPRRAP